MVNADIEEIFEDFSDEEDYRRITSREIYNDFIIDKLTDEQILNL